MQQLRKVFLIPAITVFSAATAVAGKGGKPGRDGGGGGGGVGVGVGGELTVKLATSLRDSEHPRGPTATTTIWLWYDPVLAGVQSIV